MKRIAILTAGGDTPALNATLHGAVMMANQHNVEVVGLMKGFDGLFHERIPHVMLNPLFQAIPELDPTKGGTILGASRKYVDREPDVLSLVHTNLKRLRIDGLVCIGGDGTLNGVQPLVDLIPVVQAPKTIDNDLGLNYRGETAKWRREDADNEEGYTYRIDESLEPASITLDDMVNYATPGYATAVFVSSWGVNRVRTTAESHRRAAIIEVMGRHSGFISMGSAYGQPDMILVPEAPVNIEAVAERTREIYLQQQNVVIVCGEGIGGEDGQPLGASQTSVDPAGNLMFSGAAERLRQLLIEEIGDAFFRDASGADSAERVFFTRKVGHTQRGGRPLAFDRFFAAQLGGKAVSLLLEGQRNVLATLHWNEASGFQVAHVDAGELRDRWGVIHARELHHSFFDADKMRITESGMNYLLPIFTNAVGADDSEYVRQTIFDSGNLFHAYHSVNMDMERRVQYLD